MLFLVSEYQNEWFTYTYGLIIFYRQDNPINAMILIYSEFGLISNIAQFTIMKKKMIYNFVERGKLSPFVNQTKLGIHSNIIP